jgi:2'-5' RNA ligase
MRSFIAIDMENEEILQALKELSRVEADIKLVRPENLHITLKFLGEIPEDKIEDICRAMEASFSGYAPFEVSLEGMGAFPSLKYIRVIWIGFGENRERLIEMQEALEGNLKGLGFRPEKRGFDPHLTLGRVKSPRGKEELRDFLTNNRGRRFGPFLVDRVKLKKSVLTPKGPVYSTLKEVLLEA